MEKNMIEMTRSARLRATSFAQVEGLALTALTRMPETSGLAVHTAGAGASFSWTGVSTIAPTTSSYKATALLPISDVVVFDGAAGLRSWRPPV